MPPSLGLSCMGGDIDWLTLRGAVRQESTVQEETDESQWWMEGDSKGEGKT